MSAASLVENDGGHRPTQRLAVSSGRFHDALCHPLAPLHNIFILVRLGIFDPEWFQILLSSFKQEFLDVLHNALLLESFNRMKECINGNRTDVGQQLTARKRFYYE